MCVWNISSYTKLSPKFVTLKNLILLPKLWYGIYGTSISDFPPVCGHDYLKEKEDMKLNFIALSECTKWLSS